MKKLTALILSGLFALALTGCAIPDLPGPIGIPGIEQPALSLNSK